MTTFSIVLSLYNYKLRMWDWYNYNVFKFNVCYPNVLKVNVYNHNLLKLKLPFRSQLIHFMNSLWN